MSLIFSAYVTYLQTVQLINLMLSKILHAITKFRGVGYRVILARGHPTGGEGGLLLYVLFLGIVICTEERAEIYCVLSKARTL